MRAIKTVIFSVVMIGTGVAATLFYLHGREAGHDYEDMHRRHHGTASMQHSHHASSQHQHDEVNMPGLQGKDTTEKEVADLKKYLSLTGHREKSCEYTRWNYHNNTGSRP